LQYIGGRMFNQRTLKSFIMLAETLHFGKTSELRHMTPSALTRMVQRMEEELDTTLLERNNRTATLTDAGRMFYEYAKQMDQHWENLQACLHPNKDSIAGEIRLYCTVTAAYSILPDIFLKLQKEYPKIQLKLETGTIKYGLEKLQKDQVDAAISIITDDFPATLCVKEILKSPLNHINSKHNVSSLQNELFCNAPFIMPAGGPLKQMIERWFSQHNLQPTIHSYVEGHEAILSLVACGIGTAILPEIVIKNNKLRERVNIIPITAGLPPLRVGMFMRKASLSSIVKQKFWESIGYLEL
jgi:LysR family transcriptional regulator, positive regulator for ilvC